jgi:hypothetical protein
MHFYMHSYLHKIFILVKSGCYTSSRVPTPLDVIVERLFKPLVKLEESIGQAKPELMIIDEPVQQPVDDWMSLIRTYLENQPPLDDNAEVECITHRSRMYHLIDGVLFHQGANGMMMKCISREEGIELLEDVHRGVSVSHSSCASSSVKPLGTNFSSILRRMTQWKS